MRTLANILWHIPFLGFLSALGMFLIGCIFVITVVGAPIGFGVIQLSKFLLSPFSSAMVSKKDLNMDQNQLLETYSIIVRVIYFPFGLFLAAVTLFQIALLFISIVGIPLALILAKSLKTFFNPINKRCVPKEVEDEIKRRKAKEQI